MKIIISPQAFKGTLSANQAAEAILEGAKKACPNVEYVTLPIADGGDNTRDILIKAKRGNLIHGWFADAFRKPKETSYGLLPEGPTAVIELAAICGLAEIPSGKYDPANATTYGVGEAIRHALDSGIRSFLICLGGSASNDGGSGLVQALGVRLLDEDGRDLPKGGLALENLRKIDVSNLDPRIAESQFIILCDVNVPLLGKNGATHVFAQQKGADDVLIEALEKSMSNYAEIIKKDLNLDISTIHYGGAAGGTASGLHAFLNAKLVSGIDYVLEALDFNGHLQGASLVITGEGRLDGQSLLNKTLLGVAKLCQERQIPILALVGSLGLGYRDMLSKGISSVIPLSFIPMPQGQEPLNSEIHLVEAAEQTLRLFCLTTPR